MMGLYNINCPTCKKPHMWFSGNLDQRCWECKAAGEGGQMGWYYCGACKTMVPAGGHQCVADRQQQQISNSSVFSQPDPTIEFAHLREKLGKLENAFNDLLWRVNKLESTITTVFDDIWNKRANP